MNTTSGRLIWPLSDGNPCILTFGRAGKCLIVPAHTQISESDINAIRQEHSVQISYDPNHGFILVSYRDPENPRAFQYLHNGVVAVLELLEKIGIGSFGPAISVSRPD